MTEEIIKKLFEMQDEGYRAFHMKLIPTVEPERIIGVRTPELRKMAKQTAKQEGVKTFIDSLPHYYFDENQLHAFIISEEKDFSLCIEEIERFLPYIDNWATCDQLSPKVFKKNKDKLLPYIEKWIVSDDTYTVRFAVGMLMQHFLDDSFDIRYPEMVSAVKSDEYYINMMIAWYFATALAKQYDAIVPFIEAKRLSDWVHNKAIQKSVESYRITPEQKAYLRSLKIPKRKKVFCNEICNGA